MANLKGERILKKRLLFVGALAVCAMSASIAFTKTNTQANEQQVLLSETQEQPLPKESKADQLKAKRIAFAREHKAVDPEGLVEAVEGSEYADWLISLAIEESFGDINAIGDAGEEGAFQVIASDWGAVPKDFKGQAKQAEKILIELILASKGDHKKALAKYNGGPTPKGVSYLYASRIVNRQNKLKLAVS